MSNDVDEKWLEATIGLLLNRNLPGSPYAGLIEKDGQILGRGVNTIQRDRDPTAHAEVQAIRAAAKNIGPDLSGATLYASAEPCPLCLSAAVYAGIRRIVFGLSAQSSAELGRDYGTSRRVMNALQQDFPDLEIKYIPHPDSVKPFLHS